MGDNIYQKCYPSFQKLQQNCNDAGAAGSSKRLELCPKCPVSKSLYTSLFYATVFVNEMSLDMYEDHRHWQRTILGHSFSLSSTKCLEHQSQSGSLVDVFRTWMRTHEEAQVMLASLLVVVGLWWLLRAVLTLIINLVCPLLVVLLAIVCVPQLRAPLLGQNYPAVANILKTILLKMAENIKTD